MTTFEKKKDFPLKGSPYSVLEEMIHSKSSIRLMIMHI